MRKALLLCLILLASCGLGSESKKQTSNIETRKTAVCSQDTVLAEGKGLKVTLSDYRYTQGLLNSKSKAFFSSHPEELLKRMVNRRLVLKYVEDSGLSKKYGLDSEIEEFKKDYLSRLYVSEEAKKRLKPVTDKEIVKRFKELFPKKDPSKMSKGDREFIENELKVKHYDEAVKSVYREVEKRLNVSEKNGKLTVSCCSIEVSQNLKKGEDKNRLVNQLKEKFFREYFYRKALEKGFDRDPNFQRMLTEYFANRAIEIFRKELEREIHLSPEELKDFYEKNKEKFKMPDRAQAVVLLFESKKKALEAKKFLESGKSWEEVSKRFGKFNTKPKFYFKDAKDPVGSLIFAEGRPERGKVTVAQFGDKTFAVIYVIKSVNGGILPYDKVKNYVKLVLKREKLRKLEEEKLRELWKKYDVKLENLNCIGNS
ncbi:MAG: hypothetical protein DSZ26_00915 [Thermovibrio sp.]|nr:MAG: hypothetical protein DSZ26_00915 [Thermovibrio sp.]